MIIEHALVHVRPGEEDAFEISMVKALAVIESAPECYGADIRRQIENPSWRLLTVHWASVEAHLAFRQSSLFERWRELTHRYYDVAPDVTHYGEPLVR